MNERVPGRGQQPTMNIQYRYPTYAYPALRSEYNAPRRGSYREIRK